MKFARFVCLFFLFAITTVLAQTNPVPFVNQPLVPTAIAPGGSSFTLTVNGTGFVSRSTINWNGTPLTTIFVNSSQLTAAVPAANIAKANTASITVSNPSPGGGISNLQFFSVSAPTTLQFTSVLASENGCSPPCSNFNVIAADFNGDGKLDLTFDSDYEIPAGITVLGNGDGTFNRPMQSGANWNFSVAADFNRDGKLDMVGILQDSGGPVPYHAYSVLGNGVGFFDFGNSIALGNASDDLSAFQVVAADFNRDGKLDVAIGDDLGIEVYLGNGDETFQGGLPPVGGGVAYGQTVGDFNRDGILDIAEIVGTFPDLQLQILLGKGDGTFQTGASYPGFNSSAPLIFAADLNGNDKLDLVVLQLVNTPQGVGTVTVLLGNGDGTFGAPTNYLSSSSLAGGALADFNGDGKLDLMLASSTSTVPSTTILLGNGDGTFQAPLVLPILANGSVAAGDFNNDGKLDLAVAVDTSAANGVFVLLQDYVPDFSLAASSQTSVTVTPGQTANYTVNVVPGAGFNQTVSLTCSGAPAQSTCTVSPSSVPLNGKPALTTVSVITTANTMGLTQPMDARPMSGTFGLWLKPSGILGLCVLATLRGRGRARNLQLVCGVALVCLLSIGITMSACGGGGSSSGDGGTQAGTYNLTVTGTFTSGSTNLIHKTNLTLVVQ